MAGLGKWEKICTSIYPLTNKYWDTPKPEHFTAIRKKGVGTFRITEGETQQILLLEGTLGLTWGSNG